MRYPRMRLYWLWLLVSGMGLAESAKILAFLPFPARSHQAVFAPLVRELAKRGHQITAYTPLSMPDPPPGYSEVVLRNFFLDIHGVIDMQDFGKMSALGQVVMLHEVGLFFQEKVCNDDTVKKLIHSNEKYDAVITESLFVQESFAALQHKFGAVAIEILPLGDSYWVNDMVGSPHNPSYMVDFNVPFTDRMNFYQRLHNTIVSVGTSLIGNLYYMPKTQILMDRCFNYEGWKERPSVTELLSNKSLVLVNSHYSVGYPYPTAPHVIEVGGINIKPDKPLPKELQTFMDGAKDGVIYFSLGSNINVSDVVEGGVFQAFSTAFGKLKQKVLWKWEKEVPDMPKNVKTSNWFPQQDILAHKNCKLFITHGGFMSQTEAVNYGVPMIGIPFFGDQPKNMRQVTSAGYGIEIPFSELTEENISWAINEILSNPSYAQKAKERSEMFRDRPMTPLESAVYWVEHVIRHKGGDHLRPYLSSLRWYQSTLLDVGALILSALLLVLLLTFLMLRKLFRLLCCRGAKPPVDKKTKKKTN